MTIHKRSVEHRMLRARQGDGPGPGNGGNGNGNGNGGEAGDPNGEPGPPSPPGPPVSSSTPPPAQSSSVTPPRPSSSITPSSRPPPPPPPPSSTPSSTLPTSTSQRTSISSTPSATPTTSSSSSVVSSSSASTTRTSPAVVNTITTANANVAGGGTTMRGVSSISLDNSPGSTVTASSLEQSGSTSTGGIVGGVVGGLAGLAILGFIVIFLLKRRRNRRAEEDFGTDFRRSAFVTDSRPDSMAQVASPGHNIAPSISSSAGMAGQGAYGTYGATGISAGYDTGAAAGAGVAAGSAASHGLQERPKYVYGQADDGQQNGHDDEASEHAHGVYSSEPQVQAAYNPEAYGSYAAYDNNTGGYQEPTREYQGQEGYDQDGYAAQQDYYQNHPYGQTYPQEAYDASQYAQYEAAQYAADPSQYAQYDQSAYAVTGNTPAPAGAHPSVPRHDDPYGGM